MKHLPVFVLAAALLFVLSACGSNNDDSALVDALAANWIEEEEFPEGVSIDCVAAGFVSGIGGAEGASAYEITADNIAEADFDLNPLSERTPTLRSETCLHVTASSQPSSARWGLG